EHAELRLGLLRLAVALGEGVGGARQVDDLTGERDDQIRAHQETSRSRHFNAALNSLHHFHGFSSTSLARPYSTPCSSRYLKSSQRFSPRRYQSGSSGPSTIGSGDR